MARKVWQMTLQVLWRKMWPTDFARPFRQVWSPQDFFVEFILTNHLVTCNKPTERISVYEACQEKTAHMWRFQQSIRKEQYWGDKLKLCCYCTHEYYVKRKHAKFKAFTSPRQLRCWVFEETPNSAAKNFSWHRVTPPQKLASEIELFNYYCIFYSPFRNWRLEFTTILSPDPLNKISQTYSDPFRKSNP